MKLSSSIAALVATLTAGCSGPGSTSARPQLLIDGVAKAATITTTATRQLVSVTATMPSGTSGPTLFGSPLGKIEYAISLSTVPNDDPAKYDIALVAACASEISLAVELGGTREVESSDEQPSSHQLSTDGCLMSPAPLMLAGQTNIDKLDDQHLDMAVIFSLTEGGEQHDFRIEGLSNLRFATTP